MRLAGGIAVNFIGGVVEDEPAVSKRRSLLGKCEFEDFSPFGFFSLIVLLDDGFLDLGFQILSAFTADDVVPIHLLCAGLAYGKGKIP